MKNGGEGCTSATANAADYEFAAHGGNNMPTAHMGNNTPKIFDTADKIKVLSAMIHNLEKLRRGTRLDHPQISHGPCSPSR